MKTGQDLADGRATGRSAGGAARNWPRSCSVTSIRNASPITSPSNIKAGEFKALARDRPSRGTTGGHGRRGGWGAVPSRNAYSARCGGTCAAATPGTSTAPARRKHASRCIAPPCAPPADGSIVRAMSVRNIVAVFRRGPSPPEMARRTARADLVEVFKSERRRELRRQGKGLKTDRRALGLGPQRDKEPGG